MFNKKLVQKTSELESQCGVMVDQIDGYQEDIRKLKDELADVKHQKKIEEEDIKHMVKISQEKNEIGLQKEKLKLQTEQATAIAAVKDNYTDKLQARLEGEVKSMKEMYGQVLERLPTIKMKGEM